MYKSDNHYMTKQSLKSTMHFAGRMNAFLCVVFACVCVCVCVCVECLMLAVRFSW